MHPRRQLARELALRDALASIGVVRSHELVYLLEGPEREDLEQPRGFLVRDVQEVLIKGVGRRALGVEPHALARRGFAHLLARRVEQQRRREPEELWAAHLSRQLAAGRDVAVL